MRNKRYRKEHKGYIGKLVILISVVAVVTVCSIVGVMANTVPCTVIDGNQEFSFKLLTPNMDDIIAKAIGEGMIPLSEKDKAVKNPQNGKIEVQRGIDVSVNSNGEFINVSAYGGQTVEEILVANNITFAVSDEILPTLESVLNEDTVISLSDTRKVVVTADGITKAVETKGTTVKDALDDMGITLRDGDKVSRELSEKLTNGMTISVSRVKNIRVSDDGKEQSFKVYAPNVRLALKELKIELGKIIPATPPSFNNCLVSL